MMYYIDVISTDYLSLPQSQYWFNSSKLIKEATSRIKHWPSQHTTIHCFNVWIFIHQINEYQSPFIWRHAMINEVVRN